MSSRPSLNKVLHDIPPTLGQRLGRCAKPDGEWAHITPTEFLRRIWHSQPVRDLPPLPLGYDIEKAAANGWLVQGPDGWRVGPAVPGLFGWQR